MTGPFQLEGYDVLSPLGDSGRCWLALGLADRRRVVLRRCVAAAPFMAEVRRRAALWGSLPGSGVVEVRDVVRVSADLVIVTEHAEGGGLDAVLSRSPLSAGQAVTLVVGVGETLAVAHERGLSHGRMGVSSIVLDEHGRPLLTDHSLAETAAPSDDATALCALTLQHLDEHAPAALTEALRAFKNVPAGTSLPVRALVDQVRAIALAEPLLRAPMVGVVEVPRAEGRDRQRGRPTIALAAVVATAVVTAAIVVRGTGAEHDAPTPSTFVRPTTPAPGWLAVVERLEARRLGALQNGDRHELGRVDVYGTALWSHDANVIALRRRGNARLDNQRVAVRRVRVLSASEDRAVLRVVDSLSPTPVVLVLGRVNGDWLVRAVRRA